MRRGSFHNFIQFYVTFDASSGFKVESGQSNMDSTESRSKAVFRKLRLLTERITFNHIQYWLRLTNKQLVEEKIKQ